VRVVDIMHRDVVTIAADATLAQAAQTLRQHRISSVLVPGPHGPAGILTEHDYVKLAADGEDPTTVTVGARMSGNLVTVAPKTDVTEAAQLMTDRHIRHLPVVDHGQLVGIVSIRDPVHRHPALQRHEEKRRHSLQARIADAVTAFAGSMLFVYVHVVWFGLWIGLRVEAFPYGLLTMIVSLEAIFLSTFVMISQNRADARRQVLADSQWELVQHEEQQNDELLRLSEQILELTSAVHRLTTAASGDGAHPDQWRSARDVVVGHGTRRHYAAAARPTATRLRMRKPTNGHAYPGHGDERRPQGT
jgi:uncharacterized membrane protein